MKSYIDPSDRPDHNYFPDNEEEREKDPIRDIGPIVYLLDIILSRNKSNRLEKRYFVQLEDGVTQRVNEDLIKDFHIVQDFIESK